MERKCSIGRFHGNKHSTFGGKLTRYDRDYVFRYNKTHIGVIDELLPISFFTTEYFTGHLSKEAAAAEFTCRFFASAVLD